MERVVKIYLIFIFVACKNKGRKVSTTSGEMKGKKYLFKSPHNFHCNKKNAGDENLKNELFLKK